MEVRVDNLLPSEIHEKCLFIVSRAELKVAESDPVAGTIVTEWKENLFPFHRPRGQGGGGYRERLHLEVTEADVTTEERAMLRATGRPEPKRVRVRMEREFNAEKNKPADSSRAQWEEDTDNADFAYRIATMLKNQLMPFEPSEDFNKRFGSNLKEESGAGAPPAKK